MQCGHPDGAEGNERDRELETGRRAGRKEGGQGRRDEEGERER